MTDTTNKNIYDEAQRWLCRVRWAECALNDAKLALAMKSPLNITLGDLRTAELRPLMREKAWSEGAAILVNGLHLQLLNIAFALAGCGHKLSNTDLQRLGETLFGIAAQLDKAKPSLEYFPQEEESIAPVVIEESDGPQEVEDVVSLNRGISLAQTEEDLKRCGDIVRSWNLPKEHPRRIHFRQLLEERARELGIKSKKAPEPLPREPGCDDMDGEETPAPAPTKPAPLHVRTQVERSQDVHKVFNPDNLPIITNPPRNQKQKATNTEKGRKETFDALVSMGKKGLHENDHGAIDDIAATLLSCRSHQTLESSKKNFTKFTMSAAAREQVAALIEMRAGHIQEALDEAAKSGGEA